MALVHAIFCSRVALVHVLSSLRWRSAQRCPVGRETAAERRPAPAGGPRMEHNQQAGRRRRQTADGRRQTSSPRDRIVRHCPTGDRRVRATVRVASALAKRRPRQWPVTGCRRGGQSPAKSSNMKKDGDDQTQRKMGLKKNMKKDRPTKSFVNSSSLTTSRQLRWFGCAGRKPVAERQLLLSNRSDCKAAMDDDPTSINYELRTMGMRRVDTDEFDEESVQVFNNTSSNLFYVHGNDDLGHCRSTLAPTTRGASPLRQLLQLLISMLLHCLS
ncbi:uncharacterized protein LOC107303604 isoform X2 [Oryza brachyantha]|uniref:uncharacterized protein LOC107303604 isoform X2 n=1 Tax=Oryza brachyantha TaxID=4533 RepID=UPI0007769D2B|nr:uncharacterized protein LOC107303604 isoform X2 [Oryza brachyantha]